MGQSRRMARSMASFQWLNYLSSIYHHLFTQRREPISSEAINQRTSPSPRMRLMRGSGADEEDGERNIGGRGPNGTARYVYQLQFCIIHFACEPHVSKGPGTHLQRDLPPLKTDFSRTNTAQNRSPLPTFSCFSSSTRRALLQLEP